MLVQRSLRRLAPLRARAAVQRSMATSKEIDLLKQLLAEAQNREAEAANQTGHLVNERAVMIKLDHPLMPKLYATFKDAKYVYLLTDFFPGGELLATWRAQLRSAARNVHLQELLAESPELASWAKGGNAQACPSCFSLVQRTEGCPHMTCKCGAQFCYTCGAPWPCGQSHADTLPRLAEPEAVVPEAVAVPVAA